MKTPRGESTVKTASVTDVAFHLTYWKGYMKDWGFRISKPWQMAVVKIKFFSYFFKTGRRQSGQNLAKWERGRFIANYTEMMPMLLLLGDVEVE